MEGNQCFVGGVPDNEVVGQINPVFMRLSGLENSLLQRVLQQILM